VVYLKAALGEQALGVEAAQRTAQIPGNRGDGAPRLEVVPLETILRGVLQGVSCFQYGWDAVDRIDDPTTMVKLRVEKELPCSVQPRTGVLT